MVPVDDRIKRRVGLELGVLAALSLAFLLTFPARPIFADVGLALLALALLLRQASYTRRVIWARVPPAPDGRLRREGMLWLVGSVTAAGLAILFAAGLALGHAEGGWTGALRRVGNGHLLGAAALYVPWALLQQTLFQFYLLGRLLTLLPPMLAVPCTAMAYALVHLPAVEVMLAAALAGLCWTYAYYRYRLLWPLALSQALLGSAFAYWIQGRDLLEAWLAGP